MSWHFSRALVEEYSEATCSDGKPSVLLSTSPIPQAYLSPDRMKAFSRLSRFGMTFAPLTEGHGEAVLTWYLAGFPVRTSALQGGGKDSKDKRAGSGEKCSGSLARFDRDSHTLKTAQLSLLGGLNECSVILPRSGSMRNGECFQRSPLMPLMKGKESGSLREMFPTPTVNGNNNAPKEGTKRGTGLATYVRKFPTPTASAYKGWSKNHNRADSNDRIDYTIEREAFENGIPGRLNPTWEEWLMAWPLGWTELSPLGMDKFQLWRQQHSPNYVAVEDGK